MKQDDGASDGSSFIRRNDDGSEYSRGGVIRRGTESAYDDDASSQYTTSRVIIVG